MINSDQFLMDSGFWGWLYKLLTPVEWLMMQVMGLLHRLLTLIGMSPVGFSWVLSIIFLVLVVHSCILPIYIKQMKSMRKMQALQPKLQRIQNKYKGKNDQASKEAMQRETMKLYQDNDANPAGSCLPLLIQSPVFMCMFYILSAIPYIARGVREPITLFGSAGLFGVEEAKQFAQSNIIGVGFTDTFSGSGTHGKIIMGVFVALMCGGLWFQQHYSMKHNMSPEALAGPAAGTQKAMLWIFPIMYIFSGILMPFAVLVYWLTNNICNLLRMMWQVYEFPTPGTPAAEAKKKRDHDRENARRAKAGQISIEEEELARAKEEAERKLTQGYQRVQPQRKNRRKKG
ncbi:60Kd inner membrane protein [Bifidobacterium samirii]|uniref:Membrane protein insertase YidC n=1 Tax=Bifidobacterium samirii TaxID=2306974 RepID=A0A430FV66_9BIFI|nr:60Kd inner membrane protein [Bifidobacterium samirii]